jgi:hypothetical protein
MVFMLIIKIEDNNPFFNHAVEKYMLRNFNEEYSLVKGSQPYEIMGFHEIS